MTLTPRRPHVSQDRILERRQHEQRRLHCTRVSSGDCNSFFVAADTDNSSDADDGAESARVAMAACSHTMDAAPATLLAHHHAVTARAMLTDVTATAATAGASRAVVARTAAAT